MLALPLVERARGAELQEVLDFFSGEELLV
jgi:hypothetical protein